LSQTAWKKSSRKQASTPSPAISATGPPSHIPPGWKRSSKSAGNTISGNTVLNQDFKEFVQSLNDNGVRYLVVGGYAVAFHGHPRYTKDMDIWIANDPENAENILKALEQFGFGGLGLTKEDFLEPGQIIQLGYPPSRIDILSSVSGVNFAECYALRVKADVRGIPVNFIDLDSLKKNKQASGRHQDLADIENLR
jgi:predicted nucleotidyltransferase